MQMQRMISNMEFELWQAEDDRQQERQLDVLLQEPLQRSFSRQLQALR